MSQCGGEEDAECFLVHACYARLSWESEEGLQVVGLILLLVLRRGVWGYDSDDDDGDGGGDDDDDDFRPADWTLVEMGWLRAWD